LSLTERDYRFSGIAENNFLGFMKILKLTIQKPFVLENTDK